MHSALTTVLMVVVMEMVVDDKGTDKEEVCGGRRHKKMQNRAKTIVVSNRKLENSALACRMQMHCTAAKAPSLADKDQTE